MRNLIAYIFIRRSEMGVTLVKKKIIIISAIICILITGVSIGNKVSSNAASNISALSASTTLLNSKNKPIIKSKAQLDKQRPDKTTLTSIDDGEDVTRIQIRLKAYGYNVATDGDYGEVTTYAVMDFQKIHNFIMSGTISKQTVDALYQNPTKDNMYKPATKSLVAGVSYAAVYEKEVNSAYSPSNTNNFILVNISEQKVYIFYGTNYSWKLINTFSCGSGKDSTPTVTGHFCIGLKGLYFKSGTSVYCKYFSQISGNYLFHSILYDENGNVLDGDLGVVESHGCVRLALDDAKYIYNNIPTGTAVWIK